MTDQELSAAIADAVRGVFANEIIAFRDNAVWLYRRGPRLVYSNQDCRSHIEIPPRWAAAILLHELYRIAWPIGDTGAVASDAQTAAMHAYAKLKELLR